MKLCLAGTESVYSDLRAELYNVPFILQSYYYFCEFQKPLIHSAELFLLDSGAFTFMNNSKGHVDWDAYIDGYVNFINENDVKHFFELDIDSIVGYDAVKRIRARIERDTGKRAIPVWHKSRGLDEYKRHVDEYDYISIGGIVTREIMPKEYPVIKKLVGYANRNGTKVHGLGFTPQGVEEYRLYSADSTSWKTCSRFGRLYRFDGERMLVTKPEDKRVGKSKYIDGERQNLKEWIKYQRYLDRM